MTRRLTNPISGSTYHAKLRSFVTSGPLDLTLGVIDPPNAVENSRWFFCFLFFLLWGGLKHMSLCFPYCVGLNGVVLVLSGTWVYFGFLGEGP